MAAEIPGRTAVVIAVALGGACGGGTTGPGQEIPPDAEPEALDFSAISGTWTGPGTFVSPGENTQFTLTLEFEGSAPKGGVVGTSTVDWASGEQCGSKLHALGVSGDVYTVEERVEFGCDVTGATMRLTHDPAAGVIQMTWLHPEGFDWDVEATLARP